MTRTFPALPPGRSRWILQAVILGFSGLGLAVGAMALLSPTHVGYRTEGSTVYVDAELWPLDESRSFDVEHGEPVTLAGGYRVHGTGRPDYCSGVFSYTNVGEVWQATRCTREAVLLTTDAGPVVITPEDRAAFLGALEARQPATFEAAPATAGWPAILMLVIFGAVLVVGAAAISVVALAARRVEYKVEPQNLTIPGMIGTVSVPLEGARVWRDPPRKRMWLRVFGAGMPGLHLGRYQGDGRSLQLAATSLFGEMVFIDAGDERFAVTPAEPEAFVSALTENGATLGSPA